MTNLIKSDPYRLLFLFGAVFAVFGVGQWIIFYFGGISTYPIRTHSQMMILGFLFSFVSGFLMTAVPRMTNTQFATLPEKLTVNFLLFLFFVFNLVSLHNLALLVSCGLFIFLITYFIRRKMKMKNKALPTGFVFIPLGLLSGFMGTLLILLSEQNILNMMSFGKMLLYEGFILNLIIGLGSRLIPVLSKKTGALSPMEVNDMTPRVFFLEAIVFNASFFLEYFWNQNIGVAVRFVVLAFIVYKNFSFFKPMVEYSKLGVSISVALAFFPLSYLFIFFFPQQRMHLIHILYIAAIAMLTFLISVRVSLAHGGASLDLEKKSSSIYVFVGAFFLTMLIRVIGPIVSAGNIVGIFAVAAAVFLLGVLIWVNFLRKYLLLGADETEQC